MLCIKCLIYKPYIMKRLIIFFFIMYSSIILSQSFYDFKIPGIEGNNIEFIDFKGKFVLIVNVASRCGFTYQYQDLQNLHDKYDNVIVLGIPCNQFANQEPKDEKEIMQFCSDNYNISFPMTEKIYVKGKNQHPLYQWLTNKSKNHLSNFKVSWNFNKFLVGPEGNLIGHFGSSTKPMSEKITKFIN